MKKIVTIFLTVFLISCVFGQGNIVLCEIRISPSDTTLNIGDEIDFSAIIIDTSGAEIDTVVVWSVAGGIGTITEAGNFLAETEGQGFVIAQVGDISDSATVEVTRTETIVESIEIKPSEVILNVGETQKFKIEAVDTSGNEVDVEVEWQVADTSIGTIQNNGWFTAIDVGTTFVMALYEDLSDTAESYVVEEKTEAGYTVIFKRMIPNGNITNLGNGIYEGETQTLGGMPYPLNVLNGGKLYFPENSLRENITITLKLPDFTSTDGKNVSFGDSILMAITFEVSIGDSVISPYYFEKPITLTLPFKRGLMNNLGLIPEALGMFFRTSEGGFDSTGIANISVDTTTNKITGEISHFSTLVVAPKSSGSVTYIEEFSDIDTPEKFRLEQNFPNPFNPITTIGYKLPKVSYVSIVIYNIIGQKIKTLISERKTAGYHTVKWNGTNDRGIKVNSGIYIYRIQTESFSTVRKMVLLK